MTITHSLSPQSPVLNENQRIETTERAVETSSNQTQSVEEKLFGILYGYCLNGSDIDIAAAAIIAENHDIKEFLCSTTPGGVKEKIEQFIGEWALGEMEAELTRRLLRQTHGTALRNSEYWDRACDCIKNIQLYISLSAKNYIASVLKEARKGAQPLQQEASLQQIIEKQKVLSQLQTKLLDIKRLSSFLSKGENAFIGFLASWAYYDLFPLEDGDDEDESWAQARQFLLSFSQLEKRVEKEPAVFTQVGQILNQVAHMSIALAQWRAKMEIKERPVQQVPESTAGEKLYQLYALPILTACRDAVYEMFLDEVEPCVADKAVNMKLYLRLEEVCKQLQKDDEFPDVTDLHHYERQELEDILDVDCMEECLDSDIDLESIAIMLLDAMGQTEMESLRKKLKEYEDTFSDDPQFKRDLQSREAFTSFCSLIQKKKLSFTTLHTLKHD